MLAMKKLILILAVVAFATTAWAQETPKKPSFAGFVSNGFWDNWEMSLGGGVGTALTNGSNSVPAKSPKLAEVSCLARSSAVSV